MLIALQQLQALTEQMRTEISALRNQNLALQQQLEQATHLQAQQLQQAEALEAANQTVDKLAILTTRYDALQTAHEAMRQDFERVTAELAQLADKCTALQTDRDDLAQKNQFAKQKVTAIMHRLASLDAVASMDAT